MNLLADKKSQQETKSGRRERRVKKAELTNWQVTERDIKNSQHSNKWDERKTSSCHRLVLVAQHEKDAAAAGCGF